MEIKLIALDLDGTLLNRKKQLTARCRLALKRAGEKGVLIVPATGRLYAAIPEALRQMQSVRYAITINGAEILDTSEKRVLYQAEIPPETMERLFDRMDQLPVIYDCYQDDRGWMDRTHIARLPEFLPDPHEQEMVRRMRTPVDGFREWIRSRNRPIQKTQMYFQPGQRALRDQEMEWLAAHEKEVAVSASLSNNIEINDRNANKGRGLRELCRHLGIDPAETMAFGDGTNDIPLLQEAGVGVAMENAFASVKSAADRIAPSNEEDGVARFLEETVLRY